MSSSSPESPGPSSPPATSHTVDFSGVVKKVSSDEDVPSPAESNTEDRRASLKKGTSNYDLISFRKSMRNEKAKGKPKSKRKARNEILKCTAISFIVLSFIVIGTISIVTKWKSVEGSASFSDYDTQQVIPGKLISLSQNGAVMLLQDDFGLFQAYTLDRDSSPLWNPIGPSISSQGRVELSSDGSLVAFIDTISQIPQVASYDTENDSWVAENVPILIGDDLSMDSDFKTLAVGNYENGTISTYIIEGDEWTGDSIVLSVPGLKNFKISPSGSNLIVLCAEEGASTITLKGYTKGYSSNSTFVWTSATTDISIGASIATISLAKDSYALAFDNTAIVYSYSGRQWGNQIIASTGNSTFHSVALSLDGRTLALGRISGTMEGTVSWYKFDDDTGEEPFRSPLQDEKSFMFGSEIGLDATASIIAIQSGVEGSENVHIFDVN